MFTHPATRPAGSGPPGPASIRAGLSTLAAGCLLLATACAAPPPAPWAGADPADPSVRVKPVGYRSTVAPYTPQRPVEPAPWREQNERVAPATRE
jgi:hypothetical protein